MKMVYKYSYLLILLIPFLLTQCTTTSDPTPPQAISIADMWVGNLTDFDKDEYYSYFDLYFDLDINKGSRDVFIWLGIRFYDAADTTAYLELLRTETFTVEEGVTDDALYFGVELPTDLKDLPATGYDFLFLVIRGEDVDEPDPGNLRRLAESSATDQELLSNFPLELNDNDVAILLNSMGIDDSVDVDGDGYKSSLHINFLLEIIGGSKEVYVVLAAREHDPDNVESYSGYLESDVFTVDANQGGGLVLIDFPVDNSDGYFSQGGYDFLFIVFDNSIPDFRLIEVSAGTTPMLNNISIEPTDTDNQIWIDDVWFENNVDFDGDGYSSEARLYVDVDEGNGNGENVFLDFYYRTSGTTIYLPLVSTYPFSVTGLEFDQSYITVTDFENFSNGSYDFRVDLKFSNYNLIEDWEDASTDTDMSSVELELSSEDVPQELSVWNAWRSQVDDNDLDSYYSNVVITIDVDVSYGEADIYMKIYSKLSSESTYTQFLTTNPFHLIENSSEDDFNLQLYVEGIEPSLWDVKFEILFVGSSEVEMTYDDTDDPDLDNIPMETVEDDTP